MPTIAEVRQQFPQYGDMSDAQLADALHAKFYGDMPKAEFNQKIGLTDKYQQAAIDEQTALKKQGVDEGAGLTRRLVHGATLGADSTLMAGALAPLEAIRRGVPLSEGYNYAKAREDQILNDARQNTGALGTAAEILGGGVAGAGLANGGVTAARMLAPDAGILRRAGASAFDTSALGGFSGAMEGNSIGERFNNALKGAAAGGALGGALPIAGSLAWGAAAPLLSNLRARINPEGYATSQIARAVSESGMTPQQIGQQIAQANREGQPFTLADALGNPGQRMLSSVARAPGQGRTDVVNFLENRQAGQGRRVANTLAEGFEAPRTAEQQRQIMTQARDDLANQEYGAVRDTAEPVDVSNVVNHINQRVAPFGVAHDRIAPDSITGRLLAYRRMLSSGRTNLAGTSEGGLNDFNAAQMVRQELSDEIQAARQGGQGNKARILGGVLRELDTSLENASEGFRAANANFAQRTRNIEAVDQGTAAAMRGRTEDTIPAFQALRPEGQRAFRMGYVDPLIADAQRAAVGVNKARPLLNDAVRDEAAVMAPGNELMQRRLARENTMFETRNAALGGSKTADNLADAEALGIDPTVIGHILHGNYPGALRSLVHAGSNAITGNTPQVRAAIARLLLNRGVDPAAIDRMVGDTVARIQFVQNLARNVGRGAAGSFAVVNGSNNKAAQK